MTGAQAIATLLVVAAVVVGVLVVSTRLVGEIAERFGEDPRYWQRRLLPLGFFGPVVLWIILNRRDGGPA